VLGLEVQGSDRAHNATASNLMLFTICQCRAIYILRGPDLGQRFLWFLFLWQLMPNRARPACTSVQREIPHISGWESRLGHGKPRALWLHCCPKSAECLILPLGVGGGSRLVGLVMCPYAGSHSMRLHTPHRSFIPLVCPDKSCPGASCPNPKYICSSCIVFKKD
jgi:hypothetical protein